MKTISSRALIITAVVCIGYRSFCQADIRYPKFTSDKVTVAFHFGKKGELTIEEAKFITSHFNFIVLEKGHGLPQYQATENCI